MYMYTYAYIYIYIYICIHVFIIYMYTNRHEHRSYHHRGIKLRDQRTREQKRTPGPEGLPSELYRWLDEDNRSTPLKHWSECWESESLEDNMNKANLAAIYKKGHTDRPDNYRPIALLNVTYKLWAIIIHVRLYETIDERICKTQFGFRKNKSTAQPLFVYRRSQELQEDSGASFHTLLLDWEKVFDKVDQKQMIEAIYKEPRFSTKEGKHQTRERVQMAGIRQGCPLSPYLFILLLTTSHTMSAKTLTYKNRLTSQQVNCIM